MKNDATILVGQAIEKRRRLVQRFDQNTTAWRLINSVGDGFPGLTVDRLGDVLLVEKHRCDVDETPLVAALAECLGEDTPIFFKDRWSSESSGRAGSRIAGGVHDSAFSIKENELLFALRLCDEEHIGLFLDSRPARELVTRYAKGRRVLNMFSYTSGFGMVAAAGGALSTVNIDNKNSALAIAKQNYEQNDLPCDNRTFFKCDAFQYLKQAAKKGSQNDFVIVDPPPKFKYKKGREFHAHRDYGKLLALCVKVSAPGALIMAGLNALKARDETFAGMIDDARALAGKNFEIVEEAGPGEDFPPAPDRPVARFLLLKLDE